MGMLEERTALKTPAQHTNDNAIQWHLHTGNQPFYIDAFWNIFAQGIKVRADDKPKDLNWHPVCHEESKFICFFFRDTMPSFT